MNASGSGDLTPEAIERRSFEIIAGELRVMGVVVDGETAPVVTRVIHATADFDYARALHFSPGAFRAGLDALRAGCPVVTDTNMAKSGINGKAAHSLGVAVHCHIADADVAETAGRDRCTRSRAAVDKAAPLYPEGIYVVGNAPTALMRVCELFQEGRLRPRLVVGVPVGFVNVVESKELLMGCDIPHIVARGRKGGSTVAAAICNALLYAARAEPRGAPH